MPLGGDSRKEKATNGTILVVHYDGEAGRKLLGLGEGMDTVGGLSWKGASSNSEALRHLLEHPAAVVVLDLEAGGARPYSLAAGLMMQRRLCVPRVVALGDNPLVVSKQILSPPGFDRGILKNQPLGQQVAAVEAVCRSPLDPGPATVSCGREVNLMNQGRLAYFLRREVPC